MNAIYITIFFNIILNLNTIPCSTIKTWQNLIEDVRKDFLGNWVTKYDPPELLSSYDFIIVGAGPSGCVLANRLSEDPDTTVLLIEGGGAEIPFVTDVPMVVPNLQSTSFNFNYTPPAKQQNGCLAMNNQQCLWPHGKGLGGSSLINYMIYTRGNRRDFDTWEKLGNPGWSYNDMLPLFRKIETAHLQNSEEDEENDYHGYEGLVSVEHVPFRSEFSKAFISSASEAGHKYVDYNGPEQMGVSYLQQTTQGGWRVTAAKAYLENFRERNNLHIITEAWVTKISFENNTKRVNGVHYMKKNHLNKVIAKREVILSAGAFESPKLLMLSGIGPEKDLKALDIDVLENLPVGETLYEHVGVIGPIFIAENSPDSLINADAVGKFSIAQEFFAGRGPLTSNGVESLLYMKTNYSQEPDPMYPDIEIMQVMTSLAFDLAPGTRRSLNLRNDIYNSIIKPIENNRTFQYIPLLLHPRTKGSITLQSKNPLTKPKFDYTFFKEEDDVNALVEAIKEAIRITNQRSFDSLKPKLYTPKLQNCPDFEQNSDEYWRCYVKFFTCTLHHQVTTTKMGPASDPEAIVDARLRVYGIQGLRVADVGIIPKPPSGHTVAYSYVIGEKAAEMIKKDWGIKSNSIVRKREILVETSTKKKLFDWQKDPELSSEESSEENVSLEAEVHQMKNFPTTEITPQIPVATTTKSPRDDLVSILNPSSSDKRTKLYKVESPIKHHKHHHPHKIVSDNVMSFADARNDDGHLNVSHVTEILEKIPTVNEDPIKLVDTDNKTIYGKGKNKPRLITERLHEVNATDFNETSVDNGTDIVTNSQINENLRQKRHFSFFASFDLGNFFKVQKQFQIGSSFNPAALNPINKRYNRDVSKIRTKRFDKESLDILQKKIDFAKGVNQKWDNFNEHITQTRNSFRTIFGLPEVGKEWGARKKRNVDEKQKADEEMEVVKKQIKEFIHTEIHELEKERKIALQNSKQTKAK